MNSKISVIVPIYKVEKYLCKCVDSIINQTYKNLEIILVDDGSPDNCPQICDDYAKKDSRIKVVHKENGGLSDARNAGMKVATGEYVSFIDSDDYISLDFYQTLVNVMVNEKSDIAECDLVKFYEDKPIESVDSTDEIITFDTEKGLSMLMAENEFHQHVWNKLYKSDIALSVPFAKGKLNEDEFWTYQIFGQAKKVSKIKKPMYYYLQRAGSIMGNGYNLRRLDALEGKNNRQKYIEKNFPNLVTQAKIDLYGSCMFAYQCVLKFMKGSDKKIAKRKIKQYKAICNLSLSEIKTINNSSQKWFYFAKFSFYLCCKFRAVTGIGF